jgi:hypothetical protein
MAELNMAEEYTLIDGDILEDMFEDHSSTFDRFTHVIVCDPSGVFFRMVPYIYARNITRVRQSLRIVPLNLYPEQKEYAVRDELLQLISTNPALICSLIDKQEAILPSLYQELREYEQLEMLDDEIAHTLSRRLVAFLKTIRVGNYGEDGIFWLPENYEGASDQIEQKVDEDYEDYTRKIICRHIKCRRLPMAHLIPISNNHLDEMKYLIDTLSNYNGGQSLIINAQLTHFAPLFRNRSDIYRQGLKTLMAEEFRCVKNEENIDGNVVFIFNNEQLNISGKTIHTDQARDNLRYYVGDYFDDLDLSKSFITGSAITASLIKTSRDTSYENRAIMIDLLYPKVITKLAPEHEDYIRETNINLWNISVLTETEGIMIKGSEIIPFDIKSGSDVDLAVDNRVSDVEYRQIAQRHFEVIRRYYPYVKIREYTKPKGDWNYVIYTDDPQYIPVFRTVEIYRSSFRNICSHHVGAVRGCFTSCWSQIPQFYLTASAVMTSMTNSTPNYHYFAGRKSNPQDIIIKNKQRGIGILDNVLDGIIVDYCQAKDITESHLPFYKGRKVPYSIFSASLEYAFVQEELRLERERKERINRRKQENQRRRREQEQNWIRERQAFVEVAQLPKVNIPSLNIVPPLTLPQINRTKIPTNLPSS